MKNDALTRIYTKPLFELAIESKSVDKIASEVEALAQLFKKVPTLTEYLDSPNVTRFAKLELLQKAYKRPWSQYFSRFLELVLRKGRQEILPYAWDAFKRYWDEYRSLLDVTATTAVELSQEQKRMIAEIMARRTGKNIVLKSKIDRKIMGGLRLQIGHQLLDATIAGKLATLKDILLRA